MQETKMKIIEEWNVIRPKQMAKLVESIPKRFQAVLDNSGLRYSIQCCLILVLF